MKSRNTQKTRTGTVYPPLPESAVDDGQRTTKAYSIAPSESASQAGGRRLRQQQQLLEQQAREQQEREAREREERLAREAERSERQSSHKPSKSVKSTTEVNGRGSGGTSYAKSQSGGE